MTECRRRNLGAVAIDGVDGGLRWKRSGGVYGAVPAWPAGKSSALPQIPPISVNTVEICLRYRQDFWVIDGRDFLFFFPLWSILQLGIDYMVPLDDIKSAWVSLPVTESYFSDPRCITRYSLRTRSNWSARTLHIRIKNPSANLQGASNSHQERSKYLVSYSIYSKHLYPMTKVLVLPDAEKAGPQRTGCGIMRALEYVYMFRFCNKGQREQIKEDGRW